MRSINATLLSILALVFSGCDRSGPPVRFVLPEGFRGVFQISVDRQNGSELTQSNGTIIIIVPTNACVVAKDDRFLTRWHKETASYPSGKLFSSEVYHTNALALRGLSASQHTSWKLIGTEREFRIATAISGRKLPLARQLTEDDLPIMEAKDKKSPPNACIPRSVQHVPQ
jgi:hypothetical protein